MNAKKIIVKRRMHGSQEISSGIYVVRSLFNFRMKPTGYTEIVNWFEIYLTNSNGEVLVAHASAKNIFVVVTAPSILTSFYLSIASVYID